MISSSEKHRRSSHGPRFFSTMLFALAAASFSRSAKADASSWFSLAGGAGAMMEGQSKNYPGAFQLELGLGSSPASPVVVGAVLKTFSFFGSGTDLALTFRGATGGFARGGFGFALDAGGYERFWGTGSAGFFGAVVLGAPFGLQLTAMTEQGTNDTQTYAAVFGIDLLRLTVYRGATGGHFPNPMPAPVQALR